MKDTRITFSIIIAVYNGKPTLQKCLDSIINQDFFDFEIIIIDGNSNDGTIEIIKQNAEYIDHWVSEPDSGIYNAWNKGITKARGEWICFLGADDFFWDHSVLKRIKAKLDITQKEIRVIYSKMMVVNDKGDSLYLVGESWSKLKNRFYNTMCIPHPGTMHHYSLFLDNGKFDETFKIAGDYEFLLRELKHNPAFYIEDNINIGMTQGGISSNPTNAILSLRETRRAQKLHGISLPGVFWILAVLRVKIRLLLWKTIGEKKSRKLIDLYRRCVGLPQFWTKT